MLYYAIFTFVLEAIHKAGRPHHQFSYYRLREKLDGPGPAKEKGIFKNIKEHVLYAAGLLFGTLFRTTRRYPVLFLDNKLFGGPTEVRKAPGLPCTRGQIF